MGMSASQARLLGLQARQSNLEYQGQQINQERTILSQQCTALYNSLLAMQVPTPPSTQDFTTIEYSGSFGATNFTLGVVKPSGENYCVEIKTQETGHALKSDYGSKIVAHKGEKLSVTEIVNISETIGTGEYFVPTNDEPQDPKLDVYIDLSSGVKGKDLSGKTAKNYLVEINGKFQEATTFDDNTTYYPKCTVEEYNKLDDTNKEKYTRYRELTKQLGCEIKGDISEYYITDENGKVQSLTTDHCEEVGGSLRVNLNRLPSGAKLYKKDSAGETEITDPNSGAITIAGKQVYTFEEAEKVYGNKFDWQKHKDAIKNTYGDSRDPEDFVLYVETNEDGVSSLKFALKEDVSTNEGNILDGFAKTFSYTPNGTFTKSEAVEGCDLEFDSQGRITKIMYPERDTEGKIIGRREIELTAKTVTDEAAYQDAYNQYEYKQYEYDKAQQDINRKTEIIQQEDRNLELKLQRLDNERTQITTEIEAVEKVIQENIESSYKTFSG